MPRRRVRCGWSVTDIYHEYHDKEWGRLLHSDAKLFEMLCLESMQAGLSWLTILKKREAFREAFDGFDIYKMAAYDEKKIAELMQNADIVRNRRKIEALIGNARCFIEIRLEYDTFDSYFWGFTGGKPIKNKWKELADIPVSTELSDKISADMKSRGFKFVGTKIVYAFMQSVGMVNDHLVDCFVYNKV